MITEKQKKQIGRVNKRLSLAFWTWPGLIRALSKDNDETQLKMKRLVEWIQATHRLGPPTRIKKILSKPKLKAVALLFLLPTMLFGQPAPVLRNSWSTNAAGTPVRGLNNLSVTNLLSGTNWQFYSIGPATVARLTDVTNIASGFTGDAGGTNARQFGSANLTNWSNIPTGAMANVVSTTFLTNWANAISNLTSTKQNGSDNLTNWSNIPTGSMANVVSTTFLTNWANSISNRVDLFSVANSNLSYAIGTASTNRENLFSVAASNLSYAIGTASTNYAAGTANNVSNWVNSVSNRLDLFSVAASNLSYAIGTASTNRENLFSVAASNLSYAIGTASTNYASGTANNVSNWVNSVSNRLDLFSVSASNLSYAIGTASTNRENLFSVAASNLSYAIGTASTNYTIAATNSASVTSWINFRQIASASLTNLSGNVNVATQILGVLNVTVTSNNAGIYTIAGNSNLFVRAGQSTSNAFVGGVMFFDTGLYTNCCNITTLTNMNQFTVPAHTLTNNGDTLRWWIAGKMAVASSTNELVMIYGSETLLDTSLLGASNRHWTATGTITRTGSTSQRVESTLWWPGAGASPIFTNNVADIVQTNGIATVLKLQAASRRVVLTNMLLKVAYEPAPF